MLRNKAICLLFLLLFLVAWHFSGMDLRFVLNEVITRFIRDGILALALLLPILAGMGLNFAVTIGAICAQVGILLVLDWQLPGLTGLLTATGLGLALALGLGALIGHGLNQVRGKEMIATLFMGFVGTSIYQMIFMVGYGTFITPHNPEIILSRGIGIRSMVDLAPFRGLMENLWVVEISGLRFPLFMIALVLAACLALAYLMRTRLGRHIRAVGEDPEKAALVGLPVNRIRLIAMLLSTVIACLGQIIFLENIGMMNVYTAHLNSDIFAAAALLAGGATIRRASVGNVLLGLILFHALFIVSPQAGQHLFGNASLGEYFRSFIAYGTIALALLINIRTEKSR